MKHFTIEDDKIEEILRPETDIERLLLRQPEFVEGLHWGIPRFGHPEGQVLFHIREVLDNVDKLAVDTMTRKRLRTITFAHDTFKYKEHKGTPRDWSRHHAALARQFMANFTADEATLDILEWHDEAYYAWRAAFLYDDPEQSKNRLTNLINRVGNHMQLYYLFFKCDTQTGDKIQTPVDWFEKTIKGIKIVKF